MAKRTCSIDECERPSHARGWCNMHYHRWKAHGDPLHVERIWGDDIARFWSKVDKASGDCWVWRGTKAGDGYGRFHVRPESNDGRLTRAAHRYAYELLVGPIPEGLWLDHLCRNRGCVNPGHLEPVTHRENTLRGIGPAAVNARKTHCPQGHPYDEKNTWIDRTGRRKCRECRRVAWRKWHASRDLTATGAPA